MLELCGKKLLFDPFISHNPLAKHIDITTLMPDYILLSHGHGDHVADLLPIQKQSGAKVICIAEIANWLGTKGVDNVIGMNIGGTVKEPTFSAKMVLAIHSSTLPDGSSGGTAAGFVISAEYKKVYFAGDTALTSDMKLLADDNLNWAILPIGDHYTMGIDDAIKATAFINCKKVIGVHYDSFPAIVIDHQEALNKCTAAGVELHLPAIGESMEL